MNGAPDEFPISSGWKCGLDGICEGCGVATDEVVEVAGGAVEVALGGSGV
jgi:hypothetical protein